MGCAQLIYAKDGRPIHVEGDPRSPINQGTLCPKGAAKGAQVIRAGAILQALLGNVGRPGAGLLARRPPGPRRRDATGGDRTEVFLKPASLSGEKAGSFTNTHRLVQWHDKVVEAPGDS